VKDLLRRVLNLPRYGALALRDPQQSVEVWLEGWGEPRDVTCNQVVACLRPFTIGIILSEQVGEGILRLCFYRRGSRRLMGRLHLKAVGSIPLTGRHFCLFEVAGCDNYCVSPLPLRAYDLREQARAERRQRRNPHNFRMTHPDIRASHVFYICPRPVVLVSVEHEGAGNLFPMDLIGPTDSAYFSMALRLTSPAVELMRQSRRMALAGVPFSHKDTAYKLGEHHRKAAIDWETLPFPLERSAQFGLPVARDALRVREVQVEECHTVGSHMVFLTSVVSDTPGVRPQEQQLFHAFYGTGNMPPD
jgi:flavin reductase (DIM6/NTAB) family NADH-FMN oxidoreductase RutF